MKMLIDFHHSQALMALYLLFNDRLGFDIYLPSKEFNEKHGVRNFSYESVGRMREHYPNFKCLEDESQIEEMDILMPTIRENSVKFLDFRERINPKAKVIARTGNDNCYMWGCDGLMSPTMTSYYYHKFSYDNRLRYQTIRPPGVPEKYHEKRVNHLHHFPEIDTRFYKWQGVPSEEDYRNINCYMAALGPTNTPDRCTQCRQKLPESDVYAPGLKDMFLRCQAGLKQHDITLRGYGHSSTDGNLEYDVIGDYMARSGMTWHYKTYEGWGFSVLCSLFVGRPIITHAKWLMGRMCWKFFIPERTAFFTAWHKEDIQDEIVKYMSDYERVCKLCEKTREITRAILDYDHEEYRVRKWLETIL